MRMLGQIVVRGAEITASPDGPMLIHFIFWQMTHGAGGRNTMILGLFIIRGHFLIACFLLKTADLPVRTLYSGDWASGRTALKSALAAWRIHPPPSWNSPPVSHTLVISAVSTWSGQLFISYNLEDESLKLFLTKLNANLLVKLPELSLFTWRTSRVKGKVSF